MQDGALTPVFLSVGLKDISPWSCPDVAICCTVQTDRTRLGKGYSGPLMLRTSFFERLSCPRPHLPAAPPIPRCRLSPPSALRFSLSESASRPMPTAPFFAPCPNPAASSRACARFRFAAFWPRRSVRGAFFGRGVWPLRGLEAAIGSSRRRSGREAAPEPDVSGLMSDERCESSFESCLADYGRGQRLLVHLEKAGETYDSSTSSSACFSRAATPLASPAAAAAFRLAALPPTYLTFDASAIDGLTCRFLTFPACAKTFVSASAGSGTSSGTGAQTHLELAHFSLAHGRSCRLRTRSYCC